MGCFDGAEVCELVGLYILSKLKHLIMNFGLYRDDGLGVTTLTPRQTDLMKKEICKIFKEEQLSITIDVNMKVVNYLDVTLDLNTGLYKPYMKENDIPRYVNKGSNHPPSILKNIPAAVNRRLNAISANEEVFYEAAPPYQAALEQSGYDYKLTYDAQTPSTNKKRRRDRKITWINPPWSNMVQTNFGGKFLRLLDICFPPSHPLHKVMNRNTIKVSYRCMPNMQKAISSHNIKVCKGGSTPQPIPNCNCLGGLANCPVQGQCQTKGVIKHQ